MVEEMKELDEMIQAKYKGYSVFQLPQDRQDCYRDMLYVISTLHSEYVLFEDEDGTVIERMQSEIAEEVEEELRYQAMCTMVNMIVAEIDTIVELDD